MKVVVPVKLDEYYCYLMRYVLSCPKTLCALQMAEG